MNAVLAVCNIGIVEPISTSLISTFPVWRPKASIIRFRRRRRRYPSIRLLARASLATEPVEGQAPSPSESESVARRLILLRHAESSWERPSLRDHDRPLSKAGQADAVIVSYKLQQLGWIPQLILSSDAVRTRETLKIMQEQAPAFLDAEVRFISSFYSIAAMDGQTAEHLQQIICRYSRDEILTIMCMGHNRGWEEAASMFTGASVELKTCNAALLEATGKTWEEAFALAGLGGWKLQGIVKPSSSLEKF
ncbi:hypothetical protein F2P56_006883 [Juglans regia]|uniref:Uncharacterized protein At3g52155, chloroplastic isoform X1 n=2 Tax=Juglans regia TaxID=51240 RepID=A0A2I4F8Z0_JUGRE|nr:uncharacterized protein At3g52155, chloroplastic isoform X1 [Juglans regia]KAF5475036.1 hypothetical protein F2P56_006883 [Juglans regia]